MNVLVVYAHHEPNSLTAALKNQAVEILTRQGHTITVSDLYGEGFSAVAQKWDFVTTSGEHFNYMLEQRHASRLQMAFSPDILSEIKKVQAADFIIFVTPLWWSGVPAILKGWFDRVLAMGFAWDGGKIYSSGLLRGKQAMMVVSAGHPADFFTPEGPHKATLSQLLHPINFTTLAFCGLNVHEPFMATNTLGQDSNGLSTVLQEFQFRLQHLIDSPQWLVYYN